MTETLPSIVATGVEQGVVALLGTKSSEELLLLISHEDVLLMSAAFTAIVYTWSSRDSLSSIGVVSSLLYQVMSTVTLNTLLGYVTVPGDSITTCFNLLCVFFAGYALHQGEPSMAAQYVLVANVTAAIQAYQDEALAIAWTLSVVPVALGVTTGSLHSLTQLVTVETFMGWIRAALPQDTLLPAALLLLYLTAPFVAQYPVLRRMYRFAVFAVTNDQVVHAVPPWLVAIFFWCAWFMDSRPSSAGKTFAANAAANVGVVAILDAARFVLDNDPVPTLLSILIAFQIIEHGADAPAH